MEQEFASSLLENAVSEFAKLPGIGRKTAYAWCSIYCAKMRMLQFPLAKQS